MRDLFIILCVLLVIHCNFWEMFFLVLICTQCSNFELLGIAIWMLRDKKVTYSWKSDFFYHYSVNLYFRYTIFCIQHFEHKNNLPSKFYLHTYIILEVVSFFIFCVFSNVTKGLISRKQWLYSGCPRAQPDNQTIL